MGKQDLNTPTILPDYHLN